MIALGAKTAQILFGAPLETRADANPRAELGCRIEGDGLAASFGNDLLSRECANGRDLRGPKRQIWPPENLTHLLQVLYFKTSS